MSMVGNGIVLRDGPIESGKLVGGAGLVLDCATHPRAAISAKAVVVHWPAFFAPTETCRDRTCGSLTCLRRREMLRPRAFVPLGMLKVRGRYCFTHWIYEKSDSNGTG
jgi:hypothetical protein